MPRLLPKLLRYSLLVLLAGLSPTTWADNEASLFSAAGYRLSHYRSPTPASVEHATTLDTAALQQLLQRQPHTRLIDVYRRHWLHGQFIEDEEHANLPVAYGWPTPAMASSTHPGRPISPAIYSASARAPGTGRWCSTAAPTAGWAGMRSSALMR